MTGSHDTRHGVALVADIVGSRHLADRDDAQQRIHEVFARAHEIVRPDTSAWATVGDEFQAVYATWQDALRATLLVAVMLPEHVVLRYGLGEGEVRRVDEGPQGEIHDGTAWYNAREAVETAHGSHRPDGLATAFVGSDDSLAQAINAQLVIRDHVVSRLKARERRLVAHLLEGATQVEAARREGITQSAVSQSINRSGGAHLLAADALLRKAA